MFAATLSLMLSKTKKSQKFRSSVFGCIVYTNLSSARNYVSAS